MNTDALECYIEAGNIASKVLKETTTLASKGEGMPVLEIAETAESRVKELGGELAFPCNISINNIASHYTPEAGDSLTLEMGDVVKIDVGVHIDGYIADTAATVEVMTSRHEALIVAARQALEMAISVTRYGTRTEQIGAVIEQTITEMGFSPLFDLTGHSLGRYELHSDMNIPNYQTSYGHVLQKDDVLAIEPFATYGQGTTFDLHAQIFGLNRLLEKKIEDADEKLRTLHERFGWFPFAHRWIEDWESLEEYVNSGDIESYPVLADISGGFVSQFEHTVIVEESGCRVIT